MNLLHFAVVSGTVLWTVMVIAWFAVNIANNGHQLPGEYR